MRLTLHCIALPWVFLGTPQVMDKYLRDRAEKNGATVKNGLYLRASQEGNDGPFTITYSDYTDGGKVGSNRNTPSLSEALATS